MPPKRKTLFAVLFITLAVISVSYGNKPVDRLSIKDQIPTKNSSSEDALFKDNDAFLDILPELREILNDTELQSILMAALFECFVRNIYGLSLEQLCPIEIDNEDFEGTLSPPISEMYDSTNPSPLSGKGRSGKNEFRLDTNFESKDEQPNVIPIRSENEWYDEFKIKYERTKNEYPVNLTTTLPGQTGVLHESDHTIFYKKYQRRNTTADSGNLKLDKEPKKEIPQSQEKLQIRRANYKEKNQQYLEKMSQTDAQKQQNHTLPENKIKSKIRRKSEELHLGNRKSQGLFALSSHHHHATKRDINTLPVFRKSKPSSAQGGLPTQPPDDLYLQVPDLIRHYGYPAEVHDIRTTDDYILTLHRIVGPRQDGDEHSAPNTTAKQKKSVLLVHGFASSSADFVIGGPDSALGFMLADAGYDVWLGNFRGNSYSKRHTSLSRDQAKYWQFSLDDLARRDVPAMVDHIIKTIHRPNILYIGHSIGATVLPMTCFLKPDFAQKILHFSAMAPIGFGKLSRGPVKVMTNLARITYKHKEEGGGAKAQVLSRDRATVAVMFFFCSAHSLFWKLCLTLLTAAGGRNTGLFNKEMLSLVLANFPAGTSVRLAAHVGQLLSSDGLQMFDYGEDRNQELYKQATPLEYDLRDTKCPTAVYWAQNDYLAPPQDVERMVSSLPNVTEKMLVGHETFNHFDFVYSNQARHLLHTDLIKTMAKYA